VSTGAQDPDPNQLSDESKESVEKLQELVDELKTVEEYEKTVLADLEADLSAPLFRPDPNPLKI
jgi:hypothetical protein